jgi:hypothetical protein
MPGTGPEASRADSAHTAWLLGSQGEGVTRGRTLVGIYLLRRMVNEFIAVFLGTLLLDQGPQSKPIAPS